jgi:hypothetical protein
MPTYDVKTKEGEEKEVFCSISTMEENVKSGEWQILHKTSSASLITHAGGTLSKAPDGYKDLLKNIKNNSGRGNTIKV